MLYKSAESFLLGAGELVAVTFTWVCVTVFTFVVLGMAVVVNCGLNMEPKAPPIHINDQDTKKRKLSLIKALKTLVWHLSRKPI